jgi:hypothetical protein
LFSFNCVKPANIFSAKVFSESYVHSSLSMWYVGMYDNFISCSEYYMYSFSGTGIAQRNFLQWSQHIPCRNKSRHLLCGWARHENCKIFTLVEL